jgi:hypothetical protein
MYGPQLADYQSNADIIAGQLGMAGAKAGIDSAALQQQYQTDLAQNGVSNEGLALDRLGIGLQREGLGIQGDQLGIKGLGLQNRGLTLDKLKSLADQLYGVNVRATNQSADVARRGVKSDNTARGATNTPGYGRDLTDVNNNLLNQLDQYRLGNEADTAQYDSNKTDLWLDTSTLGNDKRQLGISQRELDRQDAQLDLRGKSLGISGADLKAKLQQGLERLGLSRYMDTSELLLAKNSNDLKQRALADEMYRTTLEYSDYFGNTTTPARDQLNTSLSTSTTSNTDTKTSAVNKFIGRP